MSQRTINVGVLGGGQLGRMLALAAYPLDIRCRFFEPAKEPCAEQVGECVQAEFDDYRSLYEFARGLDLVTYEFENVPTETARWLADRLPVYPPPEALAAAQDRVSEKQFFTSLGVSTPQWAPINSRSDFDAAIGRIGLPAVLKTTRFGYDGKGQAVLRDPSTAEKAWQLLGGRPLILEAFVPFQRELSIVAVRGRNGELAYYPLVENVHREGILRRTTAPAPDVSPELQGRAEQIARKALEALNYVGVLAIELFEKDGELLVNEMAPRVHNSGHWTIEGTETSQFENHMRAVAGLPLGSTRPVGYSIMFNLIGDLPGIEDVLAVEGAHYHSYGKSPRANRKVGHITLRCDRRDELSKRAPQIEALIR